MVERKEHFILCYIDFNDFKYINDEYGHKAGDMFLKEFAKRIIKLDPKKITGYRIGGDEFVIIIKNPTKVDKCIESIWGVTEEKVKIVSKDNQKVAYAKLSFAMGLAENDFESTPDDILAKADSEMYKNKKT
jgi:diguanylate cyclase (GGDEF)-like protein